MNLSEMITALKTKLDEGTPGECYVCAKNIIRIRPQSNDSYGKALARPHVRATRFADARNIAALHNGFRGLLEAARGLLEWPCDEITKRAVRAMLAPMCKALEVQ